jgi:RNA recognition motif-containing protein
MVDESNNRNEEIDESNKENVVYKKEIVREKKPKLVKKKKIELKPQEEIEEIDNEDDENEEKYTIFVNNIPPTISDDELYQFILQQNKKINIKECRVVKDKNGKSRGFAFVDLKDIRNAEKCVKSLNKQVLDGYEISCAMSKPPSSG